MASKKGKAEGGFNAAEVASEFPAHASNPRILFCIWTLQNKPDATLPDIQSAWTGEGKIMGRALNSAKEALGIIPPVASTSNTKARRVSDPELNKKIRMARTFFPELGDVLPQIRKLEKIQRSMDEVRKAVDEVPADKRNVLFALFPILKGLAGKGGNSESVPF